MIRRLALVLAALFVTSAVAVALVPAHSQGESCGNWVSPRYTNLEVSIQDAEILADLRDATPDPHENRALCSDKLDTRRNISLALLLLGIGVPIATRYVMAGKRDTLDSEGPRNVAV